MIILRTLMKCPSEGIIWKIGYHDGNIPADMTITFCPSCKEKIEKYE